MREQISEAATSRRQLRRFRAWM